MLAHEIKNPLSAIRGAAQLIGDSDPAASELTALIRKEVDRIAALIDRMESFTDGRSLARAPLNIHSVLDHVCEIAGKGFGDGVAIARHYDPSLPEIVGNHDALVQVFLNLLKNAVEAIENSSNGTVSINTAYRHGVSVRGREGEGRLALPIEVSVRDNGPGAPDELAGHIFEPFVTTKRSGTGLGLALADKIVADHDAIIEYHRDREASESVFRVLLPRAGGTP
ncbi:MAG: hypothetical protein H7X93_03625 [Sphingomonadaceae bacterium]|nr:hypothetical protein [Sphingomonadaceae bacterium]